MTVSEMMATRIRNRVGIGFIVKLSMTDEAGEHAGAPITVQLMLR